ncbi:MAG: WecB/TagA/CpsF family glycosyltransferase [bacterium]|nr:WecB/TagA/CpsF family glycosyltransferase [bacterium]
MNTINILGVNISTLNKQQILEKLNQFLTDGKQHQIVTPNPEILLQADHDEEFFYILNKADLAIPDGIGLKFAGWLAGKNIRRITGADLIGDILKIAEQKKLKVAVVNWKGGLSKKEDIEKVLEKKYPDLRFLVEDIEREIGNCLPRCAARGQGKLEIGNLADFQPDILFATLGAPWQEKFIYHNLSQLPSVKIGIGVGGAFDFLTGRIKRAPKLMRLIGLEWLWRLFMQPWRRKRIYNAVIVFPAKFIKYKFINKWFYRKNVVGFILNNKNQVLLVNWIKDSDYWGLPQGGVDSGESEDDAIQREMKEEIGISNFKILDKFKNVYKYKWPKCYTNRGYKGQKQTLYILKFYGDDGDINLCPWEHKAWKWANINNLINETHQVHQKAYKIFLEKFNSSTDCPKITSLSFPT